MRCENCKHIHSCKRQCMDLPKGKTCGDCALFKRCKMVLGQYVQKENTKCDFEPIKFVEGKNEQM